MRRSVNPASKADDAPKRLCCVRKMASDSDTLDCDDDEVSPRNLVLKLVKLEDQLGLTRWSTWHELDEVKVESDDDCDNDAASRVMEERGMERVPVKQEPPHSMEDAQAGDTTLISSSSSFSCTNRMGEGNSSRGRCDDVNVNTSSDGVGTSTSVDGRTDVDGGPGVELCPTPAVCVPLASNGDAISSRGGNAGANSVMAFPETMLAENSIGTTTTTTTTTAASSPFHKSPVQPVDNGVDHFLETKQSSLASVCPFKSSPQVPMLEALNIHSPQVIFVGTLNKAGEHSRIMVPFSEDPVEEVMDIASSQLLSFNNQTVQGLEEFVAASTAVHTTTRKPVIKQADRHRKGGRGRKAEKVSDKTDPHPPPLLPTTPTTTVLKKKRRKKPGRPLSSSKKRKHVKVSDSNQNHVNMMESDVVTASKPKKKKVRPKGTIRNETNDKGMFPMHPTLCKRIQSGSCTAFNLFRLALLLPTEEAAVEFAQHFELLPRFRYCPLCGQRLEKLYRIVRSGKRPLFRFQCNKQPCKMGKNQVPLRWGTKFVSSNLSLRKAIILDYCFVKKYDIPTAKSESAMPECEDSDRMVSTSTETVVDYYNHCREICAFFLMSLPMVGGLGYTVELFESFFVGSKSHNVGGSKSHKVHAFQGQYVLAGICIENNDVLFAVAPDLKPSTILPLLQTRVALGTHVRTSSCEAYKQLKKFGYEHTVVKDSQLFVRNDLNFSGCSNVTQAGTMRPLTFHRRSGTFNLHLAEYLWRRKHREAIDLFVAYLQAVALVYPVTGPQLEIKEEVD